MQKNGFRFCSLCTVLGIIIAPGNLWAQVSTPDDVMTVRQREVIDEAPQSIKAGGFIISPGLEIKTVYDDNLFNTKDNRKSDLITDIKPAIAAQSNWDMHSIFLGAEGDFGIYKNNTDENFFDYGILFSGDYDIAPETSITAGISQARRHETGGSALESSDNRPDYKITTKMLGFKRELSYIKLYVDAKIEDVYLSDETDPLLSGRGTLDRTTKSVKTKVAYEYMPENQWFLSVEYATTDYAQITGDKDTSDGIDTRFGLDFDNAATLSGSVYTGAIYRKYDTNDDNTFDPYFGGLLKWDITRQTQLSFALDKNFEDVTVAGAAGAVRTTRKMTFRNEFTPRFFTQIKAGLDDYDYVGSNSALNRKTKLYYGGIEGNYKINDHLGFRAGYDYAERTSTRADDEYTDNRVTFSLVYMY